MEPLYQNEDYEGGNESNSVTVSNLFKITQKELSEMCNTDQDNAKRLLDR